MKKIIVVTGGCGFVGSNLIKSLIKNTNFKIISLDNYSSGTKKNHVKSKKIKYIKGHTKDIGRILKPYRTKIKSIFHFGEFARIYQSFLKMNDCIQSNTVGSNSVFEFCLKNRIKLIYSATSATLGHKGKDRNLSPYAFTKAKNLEFLENLKRWFNFKYEVIFFYNVYGLGQIKKGDMATVIGIFEEHYINNKPLPVVRPGTQSRRFTHIDDTVRTCFKAWKVNKNRFYSVSSKESYSILDVAKMFKSKIKLLPPRRGERYSSALSDMSLSNKVYKNFGKLRLVNYVENFLKKHPKN
ncbi:NAD-dependent epimerase/dehydratase family protein [Candidatus Pelagibacter sp.]|nr:NAD-dependent epimerase/dehydratase family protein [Candidatus Pelagibacter sp.]|tara:strand:- start:123 stop:1013 length:891 start_codon:yes stop_codon:yes gene_type:complete